MKWSEGEIESFKSALRSHGKNWSAIAEGMTSSASAAASGGEKAAATPVLPGGGAKGGKHNNSSDKGNNKRSAEQCKSFFFTHRKQQQLDKILIERKRVSAAPLSKNVQKNTAPFGVYNFFGHTLPC